MTIQQIEQAIRELSPREMAQLRKWFEDLEARKAERPIKPAPSSGKPEKMVASVIADYDDVL